MSLSGLLNKVRGQPASYSKKSHYEFSEALGAGAFGVVRRARNVDTDQGVAVKIMLRSHIQNPQQVLDELNMLDQLNHPHIVRLIDFFESRHKFYVVTELCTGGELFDRILDQGRFTELDAARSMREVAEAVQYLHHRNIVHRDIKPENLLYKSRDPDSTLKLCDFGVAKSLQSPEELITSAAGSLGYAAPEIFLGNGHSKPCDVWSLGVVLFTVLSGYSPFGAETVDDFMREVGEGFRIQFIPSYWKDVSAEARDLIEGMIVFDQNLRLTIDEVLAHPWLAASGDAALYPEVDLLPSVKPGLSARRRWRMAFERIRVVQRIHQLGMESEDHDEDEPSDGAKSFLSIVAAAQEQKYREQQKNAPPP